MSVVEGSLRLVFDVNLQSFWQRVPTIPELRVERESKAEIRILTQHLRRHLTLQEHTRFFLLLEAVCSHDGLSHSLPPSSPSSLLHSSGPYVIPLVCDQVWASVLKSYRLNRLKVVVRKRPFVKTTTSNCLSMSLFQRELKVMDLISYFPSCLREEDVHRIAEDIFTRGLRVKPRLRKGVWPHLVRVYHPQLETREERESYLSKLRLIYDALKAQLQSRSDGLTNQSQHLYDSIRRDAVRTDPSESFFHERRQEVLNCSTASRLQPQLSHENVEKLVNITAVFTLEHTEVSYTQGMTDLLSPILYVMEREDDAYIVFSAMVQRISDNFGIWCEGTLKKIERLRHLCSVLDPQLSAYLDSIQDDAFALFFGMVLIECRREFSFESSFHLLEVIWAAALCMRQREDPNWSPLATPRRRRHRRIQVSCSEVSDDLDAVPSYSEWASFMSNRSPDLIRQVFGELQTYSAIPLTRSESILCHSITNSTTYPPPPPPPPPHPHTPPVTESHVYTSSREQASGHMVYTVVQAERGRDLCRADTTAADDIENETIKSEETKTETYEDEIGRREESGYCEEVTREPSKFEEDEDLSFNSVPSHENGDVGEYNGHQGDNVPATTAQGDRVCRLNSVGKERSYSAPTANSHLAGSNCSHETREKCLNSATTDDVPKCSTEQQQLAGERTAVLADVKSRSKSHSEGEAVDNRRQLSNGQMQTMVSADDKRNELLLSEGEVVDNRFPLNKTTVQAQTEMSDMSSVGSNNTASGGGNDRGANGDGEGREGEEGEREGEGGEGEGEGGEREGEGGEGEGEVKMDVEGEGGSEQEDSDDQWLVVVPDSLETITQERNHSFDSGNTCDASPKPKPDVVRANNSSSAQLTSSPKLNGGGCHGNLEEHHPVDFDLETPHCVPWQPNWNSRPALSREPSSVVSMTPQHTAAAALATNGSPSTEEHEEMLRRRSFTEERDYTRSPKQPFFDALETIATISRTASPAPGVDRIPRPNSGLSAIITNLLSMERSAPAVTQESSLTVPFSDSFPLFICLAIIVQHRGQIIQGNLDFVGLSVLLNMQAGKQKLDRTLYIARQLYTRYREYQRQCFGPRFSVYEVWLDNMGTLFDVANSSNGSQRYGDGPAG